LLAYDNSRPAVARLTEWVKQSFTPAGDYPFRFGYDGVTSKDLLKDLPCDWRTELLSEGRERITLAQTLPDGLHVMAETTHFTDEGAAEWVLYFENTGEHDTKILSDVKALSLAVQYPPFRTAGTQQYGAHDIELLYAGGSDCKVDDFLPCKEVLHHISNCANMHFGSRNGRPTSGSHGCMPYFNFRTLDTGVIFAVGWAGQWEMDFQRWYSEADGQFYIRFEAGMPDTHLVLHPGERIRSPRILLMPWNGCQEDSQNAFRRFMLAHHHPHIDNKPVRLPLSILSWGTSEADHFKQLDAIKKSGIKADAYWIDAGWYGPEGTHCDDLRSNDWSNNVGYFDHDVSRYPNGLKPVSDRVHELGMKLMLWFEHERAMPGTPLVLSHPEFFIVDKSGWFIFNMGLPEAREWMTEMLSRKITEYGIDILRIDQNADTLGAWNSADASDRRGMTQIRCVEGFYQLWDTLLTRFPDLIIDNCASGGRRLEFEAMTRSVALTRTDYMCYTDSDPLGHQAQTCGLGMWVPVSSVSGGTKDPYQWRSRINNGCCIESELIYEALENPETMGVLRQRLSEFECIRDLYAADMYFLTDVNISWKEWLAFQLNDPNSDRGAVLSFRRDVCPFESARYRLKGLDPSAIYKLEDTDSGQKSKHTGEFLMEKGLLVMLTAPRESSLIFINKI